MTNRTDTLPRGAELFLTPDDYEFWASYTENSIADVAMLAGITERKVRLFMTTPIRTDGDRERIIAAYEASEASDHVWSDEEVADHAGLSLEHIRDLQARAMITGADYEAMWALFYDLIDGPARAKMLAYEAAHPGKFGDGSDPRVTYHLT